MRYYITSDLHLHDDEQPYLFTDAKQVIFSKLAAEVAATGSTLVLAGDILDLTGLQPPAEGLEDFFHQVAPSAQVRFGRRSISERVSAIHQRFPGFFAALVPLAASQRLWFIPGNHDDELDTPEGRQALATAFGISADQLVFRATYRIGDFFLSAHGHEFDSSNRTNRGVENRGAAITHALYHAVVPALEALGVDPRIARAIPAVRPEENIVTGLQQYVSAKTTQQLLIAFVELLRRNSYFTGFDNAKIWVASHLLPGLVTPDQVRKALADDSNMKQVARDAAVDILAGKTVMDGFGKGPPKVVILGHTHERDALENYVNLGTWIDHLVGIRPQDLATVDGSAPVIVTDGHDGALYDVLSLMTRSSVDDCPKLWGYPAAHTS